MSEDLHASRPEFRIAISATFTAEPIQTPLQFWGKTIRRPVEIRFAPYNQLWQTLHDPGSEFARNPKGLNLMLLRLEDLGQFTRIDAAALEQTAANFEKLLDELAASDGHFPAPVLVVVCPPSPEFQEAPGWAGFADRMERKLDEVLSGKHATIALHWREIEQRYPAGDWHNAEGERLGRIPYTDLYFAALATAVARYADALARPPYKVIAVDCDNTLWAGICGEDGPEGVSLDPARRRLHEVLLEQRKAGMLLCISSKNNEQDVLDTFAAHPEFPLRLEHFTSWRINWASKGEHLVSLAEELSLGLDSFIFLDDNPKECAEVEDAAPEVLSLTLPQRIDDLPQWLDRLWVFDHPIITEEDRKRGASYQQVKAFKSAAHGAASLEEFMASLGLTLHIAEMTADQQPRAAQLTQRTNQFNTTTIRRTEAEVAALPDNGRQVWTATVADRFGEYGLTGLLVTEPRQGALWVDTFLLSCRVLGRGVEHRMLAFAGQTAFDLGLERVSVPVTPSKRNQPARQFVESIPGADVRRDGETTIYAFSAVELGKLKWKPTPTEWVPVGEAAPATAAASSRQFKEYGRIARSLSTPERVLEAVRTESLEQYRAGESAGIPFTETERSLARIWAELLKRPTVLPGDNFFDLGGHSLLAVLLLMRIKEELGVELSVDDVYSGTLTLAELARTVDAKQLGDISAEEYEALLKEIEGLSEEEVRALLAGQDGEGATG